MEVFKYCQLVNYTRYQYDKKVVLNQWFSVGAVLSPGGHCNVWRHFWLSLRWWGRVATGIWWVVTREAAKRPTRHRTAPLPSVIWPQVSKLLFPLNWWLSTTIALSILDLILWQSLLPDDFQPLYYFINHESRWCILPVNWTICCLPLFKVHNGWVNSNGEGLRKRPPGVYGCK